MSVPILWSFLLFSVGYAFHLPHLAGVPRRPAADKYHVLAAAAFEAGSVLQVAPLQFVTAGSALRLGGRRLPPGTPGVWFVLAGHADVADPHQRDTWFENLASGYTWVLWVPYAKTHPPTSVGITRVNPPETATIDTSDTSVTVHAPAAPEQAAGSWFVLQGSAVLADRGRPETKAVNLSIGANVFRWRVLYYPDVEVVTDVVVHRKELVAAPDIAETTIRLPDPAPSSGLVPPHCALRIHDCSVHADCVPQGDGFTCLCRPGFEGDGRDCADVDECQRHPCHPNAICANTIGAYTCTCREPYVGDGHTCNLEGSTATNVSASWWDGWQLPWESDSMEGRLCFFAITTLLLLLIGHRVWMEEWMEEEEDEEIVAEEGSEEGDREGVVEQRGDEGGEGEHAPGRNDVKETSAPPRRMSLGFFTTNDLVTYREWSRKQSDDWEALGDRSRSSSVGECTWNLSGHDVSILLERPSQPLARADPADASQLPIEDEQQQQEAFERRPPSPISPASSDP
eukprot:EG_transcript_9732